MVHPFLNYMEEALAAECKRCYAARFVDETSYSYYMLTRDQVTTDTHSLSILGQAEYAGVCERANAGKYKYTVNPYCLIPTRSGFWFPDRSSEYYDGESPILKAYENITLHGIVTLNEKKIPITTSMIVFATTQWAVTINGSLYKLGEKLPVEEMLIMTCNN